MSCMLFTIIVWLTAWQLPSEATLPGQRVPPRNLASESGFPGKPAAENRVVESPKFPTESELPVGFVSEKPPPPTELIVEVSPDLEPSVEPSPSDVAQVPANPVAGNA